jgi:hypothetical protein
MVETLLTQSLVRYSPAIRPAETSSYSQESERNFSLSPKFPIAPTMIATPRATSQSDLSHLISIAHVRSRGYEQAANALEMEIK